MKLAKEQGFYRNTSTCVEKTELLKIIGKDTEKHLHVRGEDCIISHNNGEDWLCASFLSVLIETPPRAWRRPELRSVSCFMYGNTSTCVEKTSNLSQKNDII